jgi:hypothetical protein
MKKLLLIYFVPLFIYYGCMGFENSTNPLNNEIRIEIQKPISNDTIFHNNNEIEYTLSAAKGINFIEVYVNDSINQWIPVDETGNKPRIYLNIDTSLINTRISYFLIYYDKNEKSTRSVKQENIFVKERLIYSTQPFDLRLIKLGEQTINISWRDSTTGGLTGFEIWRKTGTEGEFVLHMTAPPGTFNVNDYNLSPNIVYYYRIRSVNKNGPSEFSNIVNTLGTTGASTITPPSNLKAFIVSPSVVKLEWKDNSNNENFFKIERKISFGAYSEVGYVAANVNKFTDSANGLISGSEYFYRVKAYSGTDSAASNEIYVKTPSYQLLPPTIISISNSGVRKADLRWQDNDSHYANFLIERRTQAGSFSQIAEVQGYLNKYEDTELTENSTYFYRIRTTDGNLYSEYSTEVSVYIAAAQISPPTNVSAVHLGNKLTEVRWTYSSGASLFMIERRELTAFSSFVKIGEVSGSSRLFEDRTTECQKSYIYRLKAVEGNLQSIYSNEAKSFNWELCP